MSNQIKTIKKWHEKVGSKNQWIFYLLGPCKCKRLNSAAVCQKHGTPKACGASPDFTIFFPWIFDMWWSPGGGTGGLVPGPRLQGVWTSLPALWPWNGPSTKAPALHQLQYEYAWWHPYYNLIITSLWPTIAYILAILYPFSLVVSHVYLFVRPYKSDD